VTFGPSIAVLLPTTSPPINTCAKGFSFHFTGVAMAAETETVRCGFVGDFKVGDNILANGKALCRLSTTNEDKIFNKLMVVQAGSIVEAALDQIIYRAQNYTKEGVPNIPAEVLKKIRDTEIERFNNIIQAMKTTSFSMAFATQERALRL
jgi:hypothetical protein